MATTDCTDVVACDTTECDSVDGKSVLLEALRQLDAEASLEPRESPPRFCTNASCLCSFEVVLHGHRISVGHAKLDASLDAAKVCERILATPCGCCKRERARAKMQTSETRVCYTCKQPGHLVRDCPSSNCNYCGGMGHLARDCTFGSSLQRSQQFLTCSDACFIRAPARQKRCTTTKAWTSHHHPGVTPRTLHCHRRHTECRAA